MRRAHQLECAGGERHARERAVEDARIESGEQSHAFVERLGKVELAAHGALGDVGHLLAHAGLFAQKVDDLLVDKGRVDIHDDEPTVVGGCGVAGSHVCAFLRIRCTYCSECPLI